tara:strand:- start:214 stop:381 length:168 start_codon:yes stop_codon:yes gene_type:complete
MEAKIQETFDKFEKKPSECSKRLLSIIKNGGEAEKIGASYEEFRELCKELKQLAE